MKPKKQPAGAVSAGKARPMGPKHYQAIARLVAGETYEEVARAVGVDVATLRDWRRRPDFRAILDERLAEVAEHAERKAKALVTKAFRTLDMAMDVDEDERPGPVHVAAAKEILSRVVPSKSAAEVTHRQPDLVDALRTLADENPAALAGFLDSATEGDEP